MKVYIATDGEYSDYRIVAVFTDKTQAKYFCAAHECNMEEWEADTEHLDTQKELKYLWCATFYSDGSLKALYEEYYTFRDINTIKKGYVYATLPIDTAKEKVKKIMCDRYAQWEYQQIERLIR